MTNKEEIKQIIEEWCTAVRNEDREAILLNHSKDILMFDVPFPLQSKGIEEYKKTWDLFFSFAKKPVIFHFTELEITANDSVAFAHGIGHCLGTTPQGKEESITFRLTMGFIKENGKWIITHEHHSVPSE